MTTLINELREYNQKGQINIGYSNNEGQIYDDAFMSRRVNEVNSYFSGDYTMMKINKLSYNKAQRKQLMDMIDNDLVNYNNGDHSPIVYKELMRNIATFFVKCAWLNN